MMRRECSLLLVALLVADAASFRSTTVPTHQRPLPIIASQPVMVAVPPVVPPLASRLAPLALGFAIGFRSVLTQARVAGSILSLLAITFIWRVSYVWRVRKTAAALLKVEADLYEAKENQDPFVQRSLPKSVSLWNTASELIGDFTTEVAKTDAGTALQTASGEALEAVRELSKAAFQQSQNSEPATDTLESARKRAERAVREFSRAVDSCATAAGAAKLSEEGAARLDVAWRRDALRALLALTRAPEELEREVRRQRLKGLSQELKILGLEDARVDLLTVAEVKVAHHSGMRESHPDLVGAGAQSRMAELNRAYKAVLAAMPRE